MNILHIDSSALGNQSASRELSAAVVADLTRASATRVVYRDLDSQPLPHLTASALSRTDEVAAAEADRVMAEFLSADVIVIGAPMYNFGIPSTLKAWIDRVAIAGKTFRYTAEGPEGLAGGRRVIIASTRGGVYGNGPRDHQENYLRTVFEFLGIRDIEFVRAEGLARSAQQRDQAIRAALEARLPKAA